VSGRNCLVGIEACASAHHWSREPPSGDISSLAMYDLTPPRCSEILIPSHRGLHCRNLTFMTSSLLEAVLRAPPSHGRWRGAVFASLS
jgi:hypothetical protein